MTPEERELIDRLQSLGVDIGEIDRVHTMAYDMHLPQLMVPCHRVSMQALPDYRVAGFANCLFCNEVLYLCPHDVEAVAKHNGAPLCYECGPRGAMQRAMQDSGRPTEEFIRELLRQGN